MSLGIGNLQEEFILVGDFSPFNEDSAVPREKEKFVVSSSALDILGLLENSCEEGLKTLQEMIAYNLIESRKVLLSLKQVSFSSMLTNTVRKHSIKVSGGVRE